jgi:hypothetical protein
MVAVDYAAYSLDVFEKNVDDEMPSRGNGRI